MFLHPAVVAAFCAIPVFLAGCAEPTRHYLLTPAGPPPTGGGPGLGVGPVALAAYIDQPGLVLQQGENQVALAQSHRWAGDLEANITSVLAANLGRERHTGNIRTYPWTDESDLRHTVSVDIRQLHGEAGGDAVLDAAWRVYLLPDRALVASRSWSGREPLRTDGYDALAAAQSRLLARLAGRIAASMD